MTNKDSQEDLSPAEIVRRAIEAKGGKKAVKQEWGRRVFGGRRKKSNPENVKKASIRTNSPGGRAYEDRETKREQEKETLKQSIELQLRRAKQGDPAAYDEGPKDTQKET